MNLDDSKRAAMPQSCSDVLTCLCAVCRPGVEPLAGFTKQNVRKCQPGSAKRGNGNYK